MRLSKYVVCLLIGTLLFTSLAAPATFADDVADFREIRTPDFTITPDGLAVPDAATDLRPGAPQLPVKGYSVLLPLGSAWELSFDSPEAHILAQTVVIPPAPTPTLSMNRADNWLNDPASVPSSVPVTNQPDPLIYGANEFYPASPVMAGEPVRQGNQWLLPVRVFPFQYNPATRQLRYHPVLNITVETRPQSGQLPDQADQGALAKPAVPAGANGVRLRVHTPQRGLYRLTYDELASRGVAVGPGGANPNAFAMFYKGQPIDILVTGASDNSFDSGDLVVFYAVPYDQGRFQNYNVYYFAEDAQPFANRMTTRVVSSPFTPSAASIISQTAHVEVNAEYRSTYERPRSADHFFDTQIYANASTPVATRTYSLALDDPITTTGVIDLSILIHGGYNDTTRSPDQSVDVALNSHFVGRFQWDGSVDHSIQATLPASSLDAATNQMHLAADLAALPGISSYWISPDWLDLTYPAQADAEGDMLYIPSLVAASTDVVASGFVASAVTVLDVAAPQSPVLLTGFGVQSNGGGNTLYWREPANASTYALASPAAYLTPSALEVDVPSDWSSSAHDIDYVAIIGVERSANGTTSAGADLSAAVQPLLAHRAAEGYSVAEVDLQDIYDEFNYGFLDPEAIRSFLSHAYHNWSGAPSYVLLVGDSHPAFRGEINTTLKILVPPYLVHVDPWIGEVPADSRFVSVDDEDDYLPEMAIGRISANNAADVTAMVNKILAYENPLTTPDGDWQRRAVYVADNCTDPAGNFHTLSNDIRDNWLPAFYDDSGVYYDAPPANCPDPSLPSGADMRAAIKNKFNNGALFLQWFGHGSTVRWGSVSMFNILDPSALAPSNQLPLVMHNACWTGYFLAWANNWQSLGEALALTPGRGAIADYSPSGLHIGAALQTLDQGLHEAMFQERIARAGDIVNASKYYFFDHSIDYHDLIDSMIFFGDPALKLRLPSADFSDSSMEVSETTADPGARLDYTVTVSNTSVFTLPETMLTVDYPQDLAAVADANGGVDDGDTLTWNLVGLRAPVDSSQVITFALTVNPVLSPGLHHVTVPAQITSDISTPVDLQVDTAVLASPLLANSTLAVHRPWMPPGMPITVTATLQNDGTAISPGTLVTLTLPAELGAPTWMAASSGAAPVYDSNAHRVLWSGDVSVGNNETVAFTSLVSPALTACDLVTVAGELEDTLGSLTSLQASVNLAVPDVNCSGDIDIVDIQLVAGRWGSILGQPEYLYQYDLDGDDQIGVTDIVIAATLWN